MVKLQLVEDSRPCRVTDSVKCTRVMPTVTMPQRTSACPSLLTEGLRHRFTSKGGVPGMPTASFYAPVTIVRNV